MRYRALAWLVVMVLVVTCGGSIPATTPTPPGTRSSEPIATTSSSIPSDLPSAPPAAAGRIAYVLHTGDTQELHTMDADGANDRSCGVGSMPEWAPDGAMIVYAGPASVTADGLAFPDLYRASADCAEITRVLTEGTAPHLSPDGTWMSFGRGVIDTGDAWIAEVDGTDPRRLTLGTSPTWSPDGSWLLFNPGTGAFELGLIRPDGSGERSLGFGSDPAWTADGRIVYRRQDEESGATDIRLITVDGLGIDALTVEGDVRWPMLSVDGRLLFVRDGDVWSLDPGMTSMRKVTSGLAVSARPSASLDGRWLVASNGGGHPGVVIVSVDGGAVGVLDGPVAEVAWQPVGR